MLKDDLRVILRVFIGVFSDVFYIIPILFTALACILFSMWITAWIFGLDEDFVSHYRNTFLGLLVLDVIAWGIYIAIS